MEVAGRPEKRQRPAEQRKRNARDRDAHVRHEYRLQLATPKFTLVARGVALVFREIIYNPIDPRSLEFGKRSYSIRHVKV